MRAPECRPRLQNETPRKEAPVERRVVAASVIAFLAGVGIAVLLSVALPAVGSGDSGPRDDPAEFVSRIVGSIVADDYATAWGSLYPAHQLIAPRREYVSCELRTPVGWTLRSIDVLRITDRQLRIPGEPQRVAAKAVTLRVGIENDALQTKDTFEHTFNAVAAGSRWTWILTPSRYRLYRNDACGVA
jgi:hypothetical protein